MTKTTQRSDLCRSVAFTRDDSGNGDGRSFSGYGAVFNSFTRIDSWEGTFDEQFAPGAFRKTIRERTPKFQFDHGRHPLLGSVPIGVITEIREDEKGLHVDARLGKHELIDLIQEAIATGAIDGMSIRFSVVREEWRDSTGQIVAPTEVDAILWGSHPERGVLQRTILEAKLDEVGPVVWPAYKDTTAGVRSMEPVTIDPARLHEPEQRKLLAELLLRADAQEQDAREGDSSDDEPRDAGEAVEHSEEDTDAPQSTDEVAEHESNPAEGIAPADDKDAARSEVEDEFDRLVRDALNEVRATRESTPPIV